MSEKNTAISLEHDTQPSAEKLTAEGFRSLMSQEFGIDGENPHQRMEQFKRLSTEGVAILLENVNKELLGSDDSLMNHESAMHVGEAATVAPEYRYEVFAGMLESLRSSPDSLNPARAGDVVALGVVLLHPFRDGNGRTARTIGMMFRDNYDYDNFENDFEVVATSRDETRAKGGFMINGYIPNFPKGFNQSDPAQVSGYLESLLQEERSGAYTSCFGQAPLTQ